LQRTFARTAFWFVLPCSIAPPHDHPAVNDEFHPAAGIGQFERNPATYAIQFQLFVKCFAINLAKCGTIIFAEEQVAEHFCFADRYQPSIPCAQ
jgi:hypothetical protein